MTDRERRNRLTLTATATSCRPRLRRGVDGGHDAERRVRVVEAREDRQAQPFTSFLLSSCRRHRRRRTVDLGARSTTMERRRRWRFHGSECAECCSRALDHPTGAPFIV